MKVQAVCSYIHGPCYLSLLIINRRKENTLAKHNNQIVKIKHSTQKKAILNLTENNDQKGHVKAALTFSQALQEIKFGTTKGFANISQK